MNGALPRRSYGLGIGLGNNNYPISSYNNSSNEMNVNGHFWELSFTFSFETQKTKFFYDFYLFF